VIKEKVSSLTGETVVRLTIEGHDDFRVEASRGGVQFQGTSPKFWSPQDMKTISQMLIDAHREHRKLMPSLTVR
jgi:hypothetical protein